MYMILVDRWERKIDIFGPKLPQIVKIRIYHRGEVNKVIVVPYKQLGLFSYIHLTLDGTGEQVGTKASIFGPKNAPFGFGPYLSTSTI